MTTHLPFRRAWAATLAMVVLAACGVATPSATGTPPPASAAPSSPIAPSGTATATDPSETPAGAEAAGGQILQVVADELRMRAEAGPDAELIGTLARGAPVRIESGPVEANGFTWHEVSDAAGRRGWVAEGDGVDPWLSAMPDVAQAGVILSLTYGCDVLGPINPPATTVLDDGHVVATNGPGGDWLLSRLSETGMQQIREDVLGSPYLQASAEYTPRPRADAGEPPGHGTCSYTFTVPTAGEPIVVTAIGWFGDQEEAQFYEPSPERKALTGIARNLISINEVLDDEAWESPSAMPYVAREFTLWIGKAIGLAPEGAASVDPGALRLGEMDVFGEPAGSGRCDAVTREQAFEVARVLNAGGAIDPVRLDRLSFPAFGADGGAFNVMLAPRTPTGDPACADLNL